MGDVNLPHDFLEEVSAATLHHGLRFILMTKSHNDLSH